MEYYYRWYYDYTAQGVSFWCGSYPVTKRTPNGAWIDEYGKKHFILDCAAKKWAAPTRDEAWLNMKRRLARRTQILTAQLDTCVHVTNDPRLKQITAPTDKEAAPWHSTEPNTRTLFALSDHLS